LLKNKPILTNKDVREIESKTSLSNDDILLLKLGNQRETYIQQYCHSIFKGIAYELQLKYKANVAQFIQLDNGGSSNSSTRKRKAAEGTKSGVPDVALFFGLPDCNKVILVEFKRIGSPSQINISPKQEHYNKWFNSIGFEAYITNNPLYFRDVICKSMVDFFNSIPKELINS